MPFWASLAIFRLPLMGFIAMGVFWGAWSALIPDVKAQIGADDAALGRALLFVSVGAVPAMLLAGRLNDRMGGRLLPLSVFLFGITSFLPIFANGPLALGSLLLVLGAASGLMDVAMNARVSALEAAHGRHFMSFAHGTFSLTFFVAAIATGFARGGGFGVGLVLALVGVVILVLAFLSIGPAPEARTAPEGQAQAPSMLSPVVLLLGLVVFCAFLSENGLQAWSALHLERELGATPEIGALGPATLGLAIAFGRFGGQALQGRVGTGPLLSGAALLAGAGAVLFALAPAPSIAILGLVLAGAGVSVVGPSALSVAGAAAAPERRGATVALVSTIAYTGFFVGPALLGFVSDAVGLRAALLVIGGFCFAMLPLWLLALLQNRARHSPAGAGT